MSFMSQLGQLEVKVEQEGIKLIHAAGNWIDHLSWAQVEHLLAPAIREVAPRSLDGGDTEPPTIEAQDDPEDQTEGVIILPSTVLDELRNHFSTWFGAELGGIRAEFGRELEKVRARIDSLADGDQEDGDTVTTTVAAPASAKPAATGPAARKPAAAAK